MVGRSLWNIASGLLTRALTRDKAALADVAITRRHVWKARSGFLDIDLNLHLNNSSYLYNMELARWHMTGLSGLLGLAFQRRWMFIVASQSIRYRRSIAPFAPYEIHTQMIHWDEKWSYISHQFVCPKTGALYAEGLTRAIFKRGKKTVSMAEAAEALGVALPVLGDEPAIVKGFVAWEEATKEKNGDWDAAAHVSHAPFWQESVNLPSVNQPK
ncbi:hypothetical protein SPRG_01288 [Saprolegnia parasitica CBS 223.65]|uniref:Thioesterase n=1 Tax=Saprolegnia parasitica (strain CBS 223.65) TaxID=695850 RepID=A0A067CTI0_SAPPC|nr:hypothetical protein SPRG_01288 [Saprolegnia parasitica CBS 223.65]KDO34014.1 hypothetical protein SPRG_01288 [Saprolegnia parasitica CBS 223.65]|eukprot:XP_012194899.1 hypothetical protein SPRG_01288 [Saprolegnia parasitica CBS 223.65]